MSKHNIDNSRTLLIEIGTEELPPKALQKLSNAFSSHVADLLAANSLSYQHIDTFATPRRLALSISGLIVQQEDKLVERKGPAIAAAFDDQGNPSKAALGFAKSCGIDFKDAETLETDKGAWLYYKSMQAGKATAALIPEIVSQALNKLPIPKRMRWGSGDAQFVRPVHWLVLLFGEEVIKGSVLNIESDRISYGHRFHHPEAIKLSAASEYSHTLEEAKVITDFNYRKETICTQIEELAKSVNATAVIDDALLNEVTAMVEWPKAIIGNFEKRFLEIPQEVLISTMSTNQKYFHLTNNKGELLAHFITIANIESRDESVIIEGNERVIRPRFADAEFFWDQDRKVKLDSHIDSTKQVLFHKQIGSLFDKTERIAGLGKSIAKQIDAKADLSQRCAKICKCDLLTNMVNEFPSLQGIMGSYYAKHDNEDPEVTLAINEHYMPRFAGDKLPETKTGQVIAIADRLDTLLGIIAAGQLPSGDKDPYALRRAALGVLRIMIEKNLSLDLESLLKEHASRFDKKLKANDAVTTTVDFILDRLKTHYANQQISTDVFDAVRSQRPTQPNDFEARIQAVNTFLQTPAALSLAAANKRISNILRKSKEKIPNKIDTKLLCTDGKEVTESKLATQIIELTDKVKSLIKSRDYTAILKSLAALKDNVDNFFVDVMVNVDDDKVRLNRLAILQQLRNLFLDVADISKLQAESA